ncbi:hypothetical protein NIES2100_22960 [Calothrix sp. NIES-2100]|uniref:hypothetical protein n=1 Tax=Calothrix sp. NIES-2100 TaxID=1954172 RepID=UPI000B5FB1E3|nr:hypothetical protein NIES2100_22960 [Calothrix sp. NIES-2100]
MSNINGTPNADTLVGTTITDFDRNQGDKIQIWSTSRGGISITYGTNSTYIYQDFDLIGYIENTSDFSSRDFLVV